MDTDFSGYVLYCCECDDETEHRDIYDDEYFVYAIECMKCHTVWEGTPTDLNNPDGGIEDENE
jgi:hypothetical protein